LEVRGILTRHRSEAQKDVEAAKNELNKVKAKQKILATIQAEYLIMKPNITAIMENLSVFAQVWANVRRGLFNRVLFPCS
jgi:hypothetical protein